MPPKKFAPPAPKVPAKSAIKKELEKPHEPNKPAAKPAPAKLGPIPTKKATGTSKAELLARVQATKAANEARKREEEEKKRLEEERIAAEKKAAEEAAERAKRNAENNKQQKKLMETMGLGMSEKQRAKYGALAQMLRQNSGLRSITEFRDEKGEIDKEAYSQYLFEATKKKQEEDRQRHLEARKLAEERKKAEEAEERAAAERAEQERLSKMTEEEREKERIRKERIANLDDWERAVGIGEDDIEKEVDEIHKKHKDIVDDDSFELDLSDFEDEEKDSDEKRKEKDKKKHAEQKAAEQKKVDEAEKAARRKAVEQVVGEVSLKAGKDMRSPIVCVLGHVDTGKTSLLDKIRQSNVQGKEEGGITQQIGATFFSMAFLKEKTRNFQQKLTFKVPGLLVVDTPGHESFTNLRKRGSSLSDIAVLVVDIMHGIEPQTIESIELLRKRETPFIIALNKIDRLVDWKSIPDNSSKDSLEKQERSTTNHFERLLTSVDNQFKLRGFNTALWWKCDNLLDTVPIVPTSAVTGEGIPDLLAMLIGYSQTLMKDNLQYTDSPEATILEVKKDEGVGYTVDVILNNGVLHRGDKVVIAGMNGPIVTTIRSLLTPKEAKEIREKGTSDYQRNEKLQAAIGCKIAADGLEDAIAGTPILVVEEGDDIEDLKEAVMADITEMTEKVKSEVGVYIHASSLGSMEALMAYLSNNNDEIKVEVPVSGISLGPVLKNSIQEVSIQHDRGYSEYAVILAFDVPEVDKETLQKAKELNVKIFTEKIIYRLYKDFARHLLDFREAKRKSLLDKTVFPCKLQILMPFHNKDPLILGIKVKKGTLRTNQPFCLATKNHKYIGRVESLEVNKKSVTEAPEGSEVAVKFDVKDEHLEYGRSFNKEEDPIMISTMTRESIDILKEFYRNSLSKADWILVRDLKEELKIN